MRRFVLTLVAPLACGADAPLSPPIAVERIAVMQIDGAYVNCVTFASCAPETATKGSERYYFVNGRLIQHVVD